MHYFAYGSNMSLRRLQERVPGARPLGLHQLRRHDLRFHKAGADGSAKCDAYFTGNEQDVIYGALFIIDPIHKPTLDEAEGLGYGYAEKIVCVTAGDGQSVKALTYVALRIDSSLQPYAWYLHHVLTGARETALPEDYIRTKLLLQASIEDHDQARDSQQRACYHRGS